MGTIGKYQNGTTKVARKAFNIVEVWKPVCCHGNNIGKLIVEHSRILLQRIKYFWYKLAEISLHKLMSIWRHHLVICIFWKLHYLSNEKRYLKNVNSIFLLIQANCLCLKMTDRKAAIFVVVRLVFCNILAGNWRVTKYILVYLNGNNAAEGENNIKYASSYPMNWTVKTELTCTTL